MRVAALLLLLQCSRTSQAMDLVVYHSEKQDSGPGWHDLKTVKSSLERAGHKVRMPERSRILEHRLDSASMAFLRASQADGSRSEARVWCKNAGKDYPLLNGMRLIYQ